MSLASLKRITPRRCDWQDWPPEKCHPELLLHPQIPRPMSGLNPRSVMGDEWWQAERRAAIAASEDHCVACGVHAMFAKKHKWLEGHEKYEFHGKTLTYQGCVPLCHYCHAYIHKGRLLQQVLAGRITPNDYGLVIKHGERVRSKTPRFVSYWPGCPSPDEADWWQGWKLVINDKVYESDITSEEIWRERYAKD